MRCFDSTNSPWGRKINFVDKNNVLVGFDMDANCCESFGWSITDCPSDIKDIHPDNDTLSEYVFDIAAKPVFTNTGGEEGGEVSFRLVADGRPDLWLTLFNHHNGYYSHGWDMTVNGEKTEGHL